MTDSNSNIPSTDSYKGVRDFYPDDYAVQKHIFSAMSRIPERFGYQEYTASLLESSALYSSKTSTEMVDDQTYTFTDRGGRSVTLRPEMTPTVARLVAAKQQELPLPVRWYSIPNLFRYERPQRGRLREHWQLNVDIFGSESMQADIEIINISSAIMQELGVKQEQFEIKVNNRQVLSQVYKSNLDLNDNEYRKLLQLADRKAKLDSEEYEKLVTEVLGADKTTLYMEKLADRDDLVAACKETEAWGDLQAVMDGLAAVGITNAVFDPEMIRGFDYYTGTIFEVFDLHPDNNRSLFGGGRYDKLLEIFDKSPVPAVGFGMGDVTMRDVLETYDLIPDVLQTNDLYIGPLNDSCTLRAQKMAQEVRNSGLSVITALEAKKPANHYKKAEKAHAKFVLLFGNDEMESGNFKLKNLETGAESQQTLNTLVAALQDLS